MSWTCTGIRYLDLRDNYKKVTLSYLQYREEEKVGHWAAGNSSYSMKVENNQEKNENQYEMQQQCLQRMRTEKTLGLLRTSVGRRDTRVALRSEQVVNEEKQEVQADIWAVFLLKNEGGGAKIMSTIHNLLNGDRSHFETAKAPIRWYLGLEKDPRPRRQGTSLC